jgi:hypothetical protein
MMFYIQVDKSSNITNSYAGPDELAAPWIVVSGTEFAKIVPGCTWSGSEVVAPAIPTPPAPTLAQQAAALIAAGLTITSTGTPALDGLYTVASGISFGREDIGTEAQFISTFAEFTNGTTTLAWPLKTGVFVTFPSTAAFLNFVKAAGQFYAACQAVIATGAGTLPSAAVVIP